MTNKECLIIVLDVRRGADEDFKLKSVKVAAEILKEKICCAKKDNVSFVLVGCERTENALTLNNSNKEYQNIIEYPETQMATWQLLLNFFKFVNEEPNERGDWMEAVAVAIEKLRVAQDIFKCARRRILLCYDFNNTRQNYHNYDVITENLLTSDIELIIVNHKIAYINDAETYVPQAVFNSAGEITSAELENQKYALRLVSSCNATLCNFKEALNCAFRVQNRRPWTWNAQLSIGSEISICISGIIATKDESHIKIKKCYGETDEIVSRETQYFVKGTEVVPLPEELVEGFMLGGTPIPYDSSLFDEVVEHTPGLKFIGFVASNAIPDEYFCGDSLYLVVHQKHNGVSARKLDALVRALNETQYVMLCWKVFSVKFNKPKIVVLVPNEMREDCPATMLMLELSYHAQHHFWDFPALRTEKTECTAEQLEAVDRLIDSMDLELTLQDRQQPRQTRQNDLLAFDQLPHIFEQNVMDMLERKILCAEQDDEQFQAMLADKIFVERYWKVPEPIEAQAKKAAKELKKRFPLKESSVWLEKLQEQEAALAAIKAESNGNTKKEDEVETLVDINTVGMDTPAQDFEILIANRVLRLTNTTERDAKFQIYAQQIRSIIGQLLNAEPTDGLAIEKLAVAMTVYRNRSIEFNDFAEFNKWLHMLKALVVSKNLRVFWRDVVVKHNLGLILVGELTPDDLYREKRFFYVSEWPTLNGIE